MKIQIDDRLFETDEINSVEELKELAALVEKHRLDWSGQKYQAIKRIIEARIGEIVVSSDARVQPVYLMKAHRQDDIVFYPGCSLQYVQTRDGCKAVLQCVKLGAQQQWAWGSFILFQDNMFALTGKISKTRVKVDERPAFMVSFDYESSRMLDIVAMRTNGVTSRHPENFYYKRVALAFNFLYPILDENGKIQYRVEFEEKVFEKEVLYPKGQEIKKGREKAAGDRKKAQEVRQAVKKIMGEEVDLGTEVGLE